MLIRLEKASGVPLTRQILDQIRTQCATGALQSGDQLPSVRQLAHELAVNQNTILRVYERLEAEGLIERRHGLGTFVADGTRGDPLKDERLKLQVELQALTRHAAALGLGPADLEAMIRRVYEEYQSSPDEGGTE
jgi:GntR family transcriptional regulator